MKMEKLKKTSRIIDGFVKAFRGIFLGFAIAAAVLLVLALILPQAQFDKLATTSYTFVDIGMVRVNTGQELQLTGPVRLTVALMLVSAVVILLLGFWGLDLLHKILLPMCEGRPFEGGVSDKLRRLGWVSLFAGIVIQVLTYVVTLLEMKLYDLTALFAPGVVTGYTVEFELGGALIAPVILLLLSHVFKYGEELQRQSDETL